MADLEEMIEEGRIVSMEARIDEMQMFADECRENGLTWEQIVRQLQKRTGMSKLFIEGNIV